MAQESEHVSYAGIQSDRKMTPFQLQIKENNIVKIKLGMCRTLCEYIRIILQIESWRKISV